ncbi:hypothetical protein MJO28_000994 [Puccinia striiformis f. sp. tritici]|uniref:Aspartate-semialdehyde dehydrogenase n=4 Tax=Puccinia striiformis TaxID=27350 RepID=A0A0L0VRP6_9BASI|nr:hypothetical protein Pst134EA_000258 [Puccinia striiformis f. sp. tritici]KAI9601497.1 hypothetical protein H4Q26_001317 [Puccinia striiformis f. sp. tritici PST-130]KNF01887.1 hypothetical protein PSTG_05004 [Puccinia striiformis f. sp. tritici PST-78]POW17394.1 hypothetical protein PSTT_00684 [Puccinia striiformis]KAH9466414.1 hypothetical protein Pst134EB_001471 [Puccinia striiformis f. sp. tritici]KAH9466424.1 hypothetical protein Pst134EB_001481 [Puccinia striiformis f. sp. tritici]
MTQESETPQARTVGVLGATGTVGQRFVVLLSKHPYLKLTKLGASSRSAGKAYSSCVRWKQSVPIPENVKDLIVQECDPEHFKGCDIIFSGLDADVAGDIESRFRAQDLAVFSNAKNYRRDPLCPLIVPLVNSNHLDIVEHQRKTHIDPTTNSSSPLKKGFIVTNANCSTTGLVVPLKALESSFGPIDKVIVTTLQAISGGGYPGVPSLDILDNVVPFISGEEEKIEWECLKILGTLDNSSNPTSIVLRSEEASDRSLTDIQRTATGPMKISATTTRVPVLDGHTATVSISFKNQPPPSPEDCVKALRAYRSEPQILNCPSAPNQCIFVHDEEDRPQPRLDRYFQDGAGVSVGRVRECQVLDIKFIVLSNNVSIGAATSSIMNAELAVAKNVV